MARSLAKRYPGTALITGASAGLGVCFAQQLADEGMDLVLVARRRDRLDALAEQLRDRVKVHVLAQDLAEPDAATKLLDQTLQLGLQISVLINNAGFGSQGYFHKLDPAAELRMVDVNCRGCVAMASAFIPPMVERGNGAVVITSSTAAFQAMPFFATYAATKAFNLSFGEALWDELRGTGVDVLTLCPGYTRTEFQEVASVSTLPPKFLWAEPEDVVRTALRGLGKRPVAIHGGLNRFVAHSTRFTPRKMAVRLAGKVAKPR